MLFKDEDEIKQGGIDIDELEDDELIEKATKPDEEQEEEKEEASDEEEETEETPGGSSPEKKTEEDSPSHQGEDEEEGKSQKPDNTDDEENVPFHKHPRFRELTRSKRENSEALKKANETIEELSKKVEESKVEEDDKIAPWFIDLYGENEEAWKIYNTQSKADKAQMKKEIVEELGAQAKQPQKEEDDRNAWIESEVGRLEDEGNEFDRNKLLKIMVDYTPTNNEGTLDFDKGLVLYNKLNKTVAKDKTKTKLKKKIADSTTSNKKTTKSEPKFMTSEMLRHKSMQALAEGE